MDFVFTGDRWIGYAYAKLNLVLKVGSLREDGYHNILSLISRISLSDRLTFKVRRSRGPKLKIKLVNRTTKDINIPERENLIYKAFQWLLDRDSNMIGNRWIEVLLEKDVPPGTGLGVGSADLALFAKFLRGRLRIPEKVIRVMLSELSSDSMGLYLYDGLMVISSRGELAKPLKSYKVDENLIKELQKLLSKHWLLVIFPDFQVPTSEAYRWLDEARAIEGADEGSSHSEGGLEEWFKKTLEEALKSKKIPLYNDFQEVITSRYPEVRTLREDLSVFTDYVILAGSGSSLVALLDNFEDLEMAQRMVRKKYGFETQIASFIT